MRDLMTILKMFYLVVLQILAFSIPSGAVESFPVMNVSPSNITLGLTHSMSIECRAKAGLSSSMAIILSISIVQFNDDKSRFTEIASVSSFEGLLKYTDYGDTLAAVGLINNTGVSYLNFTLSNPKEENAGLYICDLIGLNRKGKPTNASASRKVDFILPTIDMAIQQIENYKRESDKMAQTIDSLVSNYSNSIVQISQMSTVLSQLQAEVTLLQKRSHGDSNKLTLLQEQTVHQFEQITNVTNTVRKSQETTVNNVNGSKYEYFFPSNYFNGRRYWLTKEATFFSAAFAQTVCVFYGGYLAEIDTQDEFQFTKQFVSSRGSKFTLIVVGGTDDGHEGLWINRYSKTAVASFWTLGQPDNGGGKVNQNCQAFWSPGWFMDDTECLLNSRNDIGFLCEIPELL